MTRFCVVLAAASVAAVLLAAITDSRGFEEVLSARDGGEAELLRRLVRRFFRSPAEFLLPPPRSATGARAPAHG